MLNKRRLKKEQKKLFEEKKMWNQINEYVKPTYYLPSYKTTGGKI